jgi:hypothetical protein
VSHLKSRYYHLLAGETINYRFLKLPVALWLLAQGKSDVEMTILAGNGSNTPRRNRHITWNHHIFVVMIDFKWSIKHFANPDRPLVVYEGSGKVS